MKKIISKITDVRAVYLLMSLVLILGYNLEMWEIVMFVAGMLNVGVWTGFCPSKWFFSKIGFKKSEL